MNNKPYIGLFISIISVSTAAIFITIVQDMQTHDLTIAFYRLLFTTLLILPFTLLNKKTRQELLTLPKKTYLIMILIGLILAAHFALWIASLSKTSIASSVILVTAHPILVAPISHYFFKERLSYINTFGITFSLLGVIILVLGNYGLGSLTIDTLEGNILAILGGVGAGLYILGGRKIRKTVSTPTYATVVYSVGTITLLPTCILFRAQITNLGTNVYLIILAMAIIAGIFGHTLYNWSLKYVRASVASVALLGEPLGSTILAVALPFINQIPSQYTIMGGCFILIGIYLTAKKPQNKN